jgi:putative ABC transport system permease protein
MARVEGGGRGRGVCVHGCTPELSEVWRWKNRSGSYWPGGDPRRGGTMAVLGPKLKRELFGEQEALGSFIKIAGTRFRVTGIMESKGQMLGFDLDDAAFIPVARAMKIFNLDEVGEIDLIFTNSQVLDQVEKGVRELLTERHGGKEDFIVTTQAAMLESFGNIMDVITIALAAIAGISLVVGSIGILTMVWIAVGERTNEIGLLRSIGATRRQVQMVFLSEAIVLATLGGLLGLGIGVGICALLRAAIPGLPVHTPLEYVIAALAVSFLTGLLSGVMPARRAAALDPVESLRAE